MQDFRFAGDDYLYVVGGASFMLTIRGPAIAAGVPKDKIDFCAYRRPVRDR